MDINHRLNHIILKYQLDKFYPKFRKKLLGESALVTWIEEMLERQILCVAVNMEDINYFSHLFYNAGKEFSFYLYSKEEKKNIDKFDCIVIISRKYENDMLQWCRQQRKPIIFLYDYLELQGVFCEDELYKITDTNYSDLVENCFPAKKGWREVILMEFYEQKKRFELAFQEQYKCLYAQKLFFLSLYIRNFIQAEKYRKILEELGDLPSQEAWKEVQALLTEISHRLHRRKSPDIVMIWMDAVSYGAEQHMPYLQKQIEEGISFENAFTVTPHTNPTAQTLFLGKKLIDDKLYLGGKITEDNSPVFRDLKNRGYLCKIISGYLVIFEQKLRSQNYHELYAPCSLIFWDMLYNLLLTDKPVFLLAHALTEGHAPHLTTAMEDNDSAVWSVRLHKGYQELDEQMEYYMKFLGEETTAIFMSDHGQACMREKFHTNFVVVRKDFRRRAAKELFSYVDFQKLLHEILEGNRLEKPIFDREYAEVQMLDFYNPKIIANIVRNKAPLTLSAFGYFGIITKEYLYLKYHIGNEFLARWNYMEFEPHLLYKANDICDKSSLPYFRKLLSGKGMDLKEDEKFKYTRYLYKLYERFLKKRKKVFQLVNKLFQQYPEKSVALRMGGAHSAELFHMLTSANQKRIACIMDGNINCRCSNLGLPVIPAERIADSKVRAIVLSSFDHLEELRKEAATYPDNIDIIDIYEYLEDQGINCNNNFYAIDYMTDEDYDVGFPFEELEN